MKGKRKKLRKKPDSGVKGIPGRKPSVFPIQRLTVQATDDELKLIKEMLGTRQRTELLLQHAKDPLMFPSGRSREMTLFYDQDERKNPDNRRWGTFKKGWARFVNHDPISLGRLSKKLTWENLGYRMAALHNAQFTYEEADGKDDMVGKDLIRRAYKWSADFRDKNRKYLKGKSSGNRPTV